MNPEKKVEAQEPQQIVPELSGDVLVAEKRDPRAEKRAELKGRLSKELEDRSRAEQTLIEGKWRLVDAVRRAEEEMTAEESTMEKISLEDFTKMEKCLREELFDRAEQFLKNNAKNFKDLRQGNIEAPLIAEKGYLKLAIDDYRKLSGKTKRELIDQAKESAKQEFENENQAKTDDKITTFKMTEQEFLQGEDVLGKEAGNGKKRVESYKTKAKAEIIDSQMQNLWDSLSDAEKEKYRKFKIKKQDGTVVSELPDDATEEGQIKHFAKIRFRMIENKIRELEKMGEGEKGSLLARKIAEKLRGIDPNTKEKTHEAVFASLTKISIPNIKVVEKKGFWGMFGGGEKVEVSRMENGEIVKEMISGEEFLHNLDILTSNYRAEVQNRSKSEMKKIYLRGRRRFEAKKKDCAIKIMKEEAEKPVVVGSPTEPAKIPQEPQAGENDEGGSVQELTDGDLPLNAEPDTDVRAGETALNPAEQFPVSKPEPIETELEPATSEASEFSEAEKSGQVASGTKSEIAQLNESGRGNVDLEQKQKQYDALMEDRKALLSVLPDDFEENFQKYGITKDDVEFIKMVRGDSEVIRFSEEVNSQTREMSHISKGGSIGSLIEGSNVALGAIVVIRKKIAIIKDKLESIDLSNPDGVTSPVGETATERNAQAAADTAVLPEASATSPQSTEQSATDTAQTETPPTTSGTGPAAEKDKTKEITEDEIQTEIGKIKKGDWEDSLKFIQKKFGEGDIGPDEKDPKLQEFFNLMKEAGFEVEDIFILERIYDFELDGILDYFGLPENERPEKIRIKMRTGDTTELTLKELRERIEKGKELYEKFTRRKAISDIKLRKEYALDQPNTLSLSQEKKKTKKTGKKKKADGAKKIARVSKRNARKGK